VSVLVLSFSCACGLFGGGGSSTNSPAPPPKPRTEAYAAEAAAACGRSVDGSRTTMLKALALARGEGTAPDGSTLAPSGALVRKLDGLGIDVGVEHAKAPDGSVAPGLLVLTDSLATELSRFVESPPRTARQKKRMAQLTRASGKAIAPLGGLRHQLVEVGLAFGEVNRTAQACHASEASVAMFVERMERFGAAGTRPNLELERAALAELSAAAHEADVLATAAITVVAAYQAALSDDRDPAVVDEAVAELSAQLGTPVANGPEPPDLLAAAKAQLDGALVDDGALERRLKSAPASPPVAVPTGQIAIVVPSFARAQAVEQIATAKDTAVALSSAAALSPDDAPLRRLIAGAEAIVAGKPKVAVDSAAALVAADPALAAVLAKVRTRMG
jgi:hypothetical protein